MFGRAVCISLKKTERCRIRYPLSCLGVSDVPGHQIKRTYFAERNRPDDALRCMIQAVLEPDEMMRNHKILSNCKRWTELTSFHKSFPHNSSISKFQAFLWRHFPTFDLFSLFVIQRWVYLRLSGPSTPRISMCVIH